MKPTEQIIIHNISKEELLTDLAKVIENRKEHKKLIKEVLYIPDVARQLRKSNNHVRRLVKTQRIKYLQERPNTEIIFYQDFIDEYLDSLTTRSKEEKDKIIQSFINNPLSHE
tara:strand:- start:688 stop:1026 length:339 start_codon:yes stop_codon:yes gene_type:complete